MYIDNSAPTSDADSDPGVTDDARQHLRLLEESRVHLVDAMFTQRSACADIFSDPNRSAEERDDAAWVLAHAVDAVKQCDEHLHTLRAQAGDAVRISAGQLLDAGQRA